MPDPLPLLLRDDDPAALDRFRQLSPRQLDVLDGLIDGLPNKAIAGRLGLSTRTVEVHRRAIALRTGCHHVGRLVRLAIAWQFQQSAAGAAATRGDQ